MTTISAQNKYFPEESLTYWDKRHIFSGIWEQVEYGKYLPIVVIDGENLGTDGDQKEISQAWKRAKAYMVSGMPRAAYIGCRETATTTYLYWKDADGNYYEDIVGVMEMERWAHEVRRRKRRY